jgi:hypothetical protein
MIELYWLMLTGSLSGLISVLAHSVAQSTLELLRGRSTAQPLLDIPVQIPDALLHMLCGAGLGMLFWLSWGLAAIVDVPWWVRGLSFGSLCWLALLLPGVLSIGWSQAPAKTTLAIALRWATTCLIAALACAWSWERTF